MCYVFKIQNILKMKGNTMIKVWVSAGTVSLFNKHQEAKLIFIKIIILWLCLLSDMSYKFKPWSCLLVPYPSFWLKFFFYPKQVSIEPIEHVFHCFGKLRRVSPDRLEGASEEMRYLTHSLSTLLYFFSLNEKTNYKITPF